MSSIFKYMFESIAKWLLKTVLSDLDKKATAAASEVAWLREQLLTAQKRMDELHEENLKIRESLMLQLQDANNKISNMKTTVHGLQTKIAKQRRRIEELEVEVSRLQIVNESQEKTIQDLRKLI